MHVGTRSDRSWRVALGAACALVLVVIAAMDRRAEACIAIGPSGVVPVAGEEAVIVWDEASGTEHFIRRAGFRGVSSDFGFVVPTPSRPEIVEVDDVVFDRLFDLYSMPPPPAPRERSRPGTRSGGDGMLASGVTVLEEMRVAGMDATVLVADSTAALDGWLAEHHFASGPHIAAYLSPYVAAGYHLTAFRVAAGTSGGDLAMRAMRLSFHAERPFFPYAEPQVAGRGSRPFRVSVVASTRMDALEGDAPWDAFVAFARRTPRLSRILDGVVPEPARRGRRWITTFDERRSERGTSDLYFVPSASSRPVRSSISTRILATR